MSVEQPTAMFVAALRTEADRMASLPVDRFDVTVPTCPAWDLGDLLVHTGWVHRLWSHLLCLPEGEPLTPESRVAAGMPTSIFTKQRPDGDLVPWFRAGVEDFVRAVESTAPTKRVNSPFGVHQPSFFARRTAHETAIHRWDAENSLGSAAGFQPMFAADGIEEFLDVFVPMSFDYQRFASEGATLELRAP